MIFFFVKDAFIKPYFHIVYKKHQIQPISDDVKCYCLLPIIPRLVRYKIAPLLELFKHVGNEQMH